MRTRKRASRNGKAAADDELRRLFEAIAAPAAPDPAAAAGDEAGRAAVLQALKDGSLLAGGVDNLRRIAGAVAAGTFDGPEVDDAGRRRIVDHLGERLKAGSAAERAAAAQALNLVLARPNARAAPPGAEPSASGAGGAEPAPGGGDPLVSEVNGAPAAGGPPRDGRTKEGKFARGNRLARGNPSNRRAAALRAALFADLDEGKMQALGRRLYERALAGDMEAVKVLLAYACGRPRLAPDPDRLDLDEWELLRAAPGLAQLWHAANEVVDVRFAAEIWKRLSAADADAATTQLVNAVQSEPQRFCKDLDRVRARAAANGR
jgi:hypothetical protein